MMHRNAQTLGDAIREFFEDNAELRGKILEIRVMRVSMVPLSMASFRTD